MSRRRNNKEVRSEFDKGSPAPLDALSKPGFADWGFSLDALWWSWFLPSYRLELEL
jgi:hypothetical protein